MKLSSLLVLGAGTLSTIVSGEAVLRGNALPNVAAPLMDGKGRQQTGEIAFVEKREGKRVGVNSQWAWLTNFPEETCRDFYGQVVPCWHGTAPTYLGPEN